MPPSFTMCINESIPCDSIRLNPFFSHSIKGIHSMPKAVVLPKCIYHDVVEMPIWPYSTSLHLSEHCKCLLPIPPVTESCKDPTEHIRAWFNSISLHLLQQYPRTFPPPSSCVRVHKQARTFPPPTSHFPTMSGATPHCDISSRTCSAFLSEPILTYPLSSAL